MQFKRMRDYTHEEFVELVSKLDKLPANLMDADLLEVYKSYIREF